MLHADTRSSYHSPPPRLPGWSVVRNQTAASEAIRPAPLVGVERGCKANSNLIADITTERF